MQNAGIVGAAPDGGWKAAAASFSALAPNREDGTRRLLTVPAASRQACFYTATPVNVRFDSFRVSYMP